MSSEIRVTVRLTPAQATACLRALDAALAVMRAAGSTDPDRDDLERASGTLRFVIATWCIPRPMGPPTPRALAFRAALDQQLVQADRFVCPYCHRASSHPDDIANRYCSCCGSWPLLPKNCEHTQTRMGEPNTANPRQNSSSHHKSEPPRR